MGSWGGLRERWLAFTAHYQTASLTARILTSCTNTNVRPVVRKVSESCFRASSPSFCSSLRGGTGEVLADLGLAVCSHEVDTPQEGQGVARCLEHGHAR